MVDTTYTQTAGMDGDVTTDNVAELATSAATSASTASTAASNAAASAAAAAFSAASLTVDATSVSAAGALMDSELTSIANIKALDQSVISGATPTFGIGSMTLDDTSLIVSDTTNLQTFVNKTDAALLKARGTGVTSSYVSTAAAGGTTFAQPAVNGEIASDQGYFAIAYAGATGITVATLSAPSTYVYIDNAGSLQQQTSTPTRQDWSRKMFTMRIAVDTVAETILGFEYFNNPIGHYANSIRDIYQALLAQGVPFKGGQVITGRAGDLGFDVGAGTITEFGGTGDIDNANVLSLDAVANATYDLLERVAIAAVNQTNLVQSWDNAGTITTLGSGTFVAHRLYRFSNGQFAIQYGQGNYANIVLARAGLLIEDYVLNERLTNATFFGWWIIGQTATNTGGTTLTEFREYTIGVQGGSSSGLAGCLLKGNNLSDLLDVSAARTNMGLGTGDSPTFTSLTTTADAEFNGVDVGRGAGGISTNTRLGADTLTNNTTGSSNTALGSNALISNTTASNNTATGKGSMEDNTSGANNTALGSQALNSNTTGNYNVAAGYFALNSSTTGSNNTAYGSQALQRNTTGNNNVASGHFALNLNTTGSNNTACGFESMASNTTGSSNVALGREALEANNASSNTAIGYQTLQNTTTGGSNTALGYEALKSNTTGSYNTGLGRFGLTNNTTGSGNIGIGPITSAGTYAPVFNPTTEDNRLVAGHTSITNAYVQVAWTVVSDERDKTSFAPVPHGLDFVNALEQIEYEFRVGGRDGKGDGIKRYGWSSQAILAMEGDNPVLVNAEDPDNLKLTDSYMLPIHANAIQTLSGQIEELKTQIETLKSQLELKS